DREVARLVTQTHVAALGMLRALASSRQSPMAAMPALSQAEQLGFESVLELAEQRQAAAMRANAAAFTTLTGISIGIGALLGSAPAKQAAKAALRNLFR
ncbi:MAG: hypothetical protein Q8Q09_01680, partial [Deltaproteobacteria bacterium]|nr:hypothetical protein [Deltaproteobacteria bacterium]